MTVVDKMQGPSAITKFIQQPPPPIDVGSTFL